MGGRAKVVKKAVAPASLKGSFLFNSLKASDNKRADLVRKPIKYLFKAISPHNSAKIRTSLAFCTLTYYLQVNLLKLKQCLSTIKNLFLKLDVCTYICVVKLEQAIQSEKFETQVQKAGLNVLYTAWWLKTLVSKELKVFGLTHEQYNVLRILKGKYPELMCVRDIGNRMIEKNSNVPRIIDRLERKKFAERSTSLVDKRETVITITETGLKTLNLVSKKIQPMFLNTISLSEEEALELSQLLEKMRQKE